MNHRADEISLSEVKEGETGLIVSIIGGRMVTKRLADLGLTQGTEVRVLRRTLFPGPVQIEVLSSRLVLGRGLALKIIVKLK